MDGNNGNSYRAIDVASYVAAYGNPHLLIQLGLEATVSSCLEGLHKWQASERYIATVRVAKIDGKQALVYSEMQGLAENGQI